MLIFCPAEDMMVECNLKRMLCGAFYVVLCVHVIKEFRQKASLHVVPLLMVE